MYRLDFIKYSAVLGVMGALPDWSRSVFAADRPMLPVPALLEPDVLSQITLAIRAGQTVFAGKKSATTWDYNGMLLGPTLRLQQGKPVTVTIHNQLQEESTVHWHGLEIP